MFSLARFVLPIGTVLLVACASADDASSPRAASPANELAYCGRLMGDAAQSLSGDDDERDAYGRRLGCLVAATADADDEDIDAGVSAANGLLRTGDVQEVTAERQRCSVVADRLRR